MARRLRQTPVSVDARVISIGNITAGGTGKTPAVIERAQREHDAGHVVAVITRGYHGALNGGPHVVPESVDDWSAIARDFGDEPALIARRLPGVRVVKCGDRVAAARHAVDVLGCNTLILDDGFQFTRLARDEDIVCIDATNPFGNGHLIPRGILRETPDALKRATQIILTRCDQATELDALLQSLHDQCPDIPIRTTSHKPSGLWRVSDGEAFPLENVREAARAICGVGNPEAFAQTLRDLGATPRDIITNPNHGVASPDQWDCDGMVVTTDKDAIKLASPPNNVYALSISLDDFEV